MKKGIFIFILICILSICAISIAEIPDFSSMPFEELSKMKQAIDTEYNSRAESEGFELTKGVYVSGSDLLPGSYYITMVFPQENTDWSKLDVYTNMQMYKADIADRSYEFILSEEPERILIRDNEILYVSEGPLFVKASYFDPVDYYKYEPPAGVLLSKGTYNIPEDVAAGKYDIYAGSANGSYFWHNYKYTDNEGNVKNGAADYRVKAYKTPSRVTLDLKDGDQLVMYNNNEPIVLTKHEPIN